MTKSKICLKIAEIEYVPIETHTRRIPPQNCGWDASPCKTSAVVRHVTNCILIHNQDDSEGFLVHSFPSWPDFNISSRYTLLTKFCFSSIYSPQDWFVRKVIGISEHSKVTFSLSHFPPSDKFISSGKWVLV